MRPLVGPPGFEPGTSYTPSKNINYLQVTFTETQHLAPLNLDATWTPERENLAFGLRLDSTPFGNARALKRALVILPSGCLETTTKCSYILGCPPDRRGWGGRNRH
jgi:hypothetical protein